MIFILTHSGKARDVNWNVDIIDSEVITARHTPLWEAHGQPLVFVSPTNAPYISKVHENVPLGESCRSGVGIIKRIHYILERCATIAGCHIIFEYDAFCLNGENPCTQGLWGVVNFEPKSHYAAMRYATCPWVIDHESAQKLCVTARYWPNIERNVADRTLATWAALANVPLFGLNGYTQNTILTSDMVELEQAMCLKRPNWIHGVKSQGAFDALMHMWNSTKEGHKNG